MISRWEEDDIYCGRNEDLDERLPAFVHATMSGESKSWNNHQHSDASVFFDRDKKREGEEEEPSQAPYYCYSRVESKNAQFAGWSVIMSVSILFHVDNFKKSQSQGPAVDFDREQTFGNPECVVDSTVHHTQRCSAWRVNRKAFKTMPDAKQFSDKSDKFCSILTRVGWGL